MDAMNQCKNSWVKEYNWEDWHWVYLVIDHPWHNTYLLLYVFFSC